MVEEPLLPAHEQVVANALSILHGATGERRFSDLSFANLYLFRKEHGYCYLPGDWPGITGRTYDGQRHILPLFNVAAAPAEVLRDLARRYGCLYPLTEEQAASLPAEHFTSVAMRDDADYLYAADVFDYRGRALRQKRAMVQRLLAHHGIEHVQLAPAHHAAARAILSRWMASKGKAAGDADEAECREAIAGADRLGLSGLIFFDDDAPIGFLLAEWLQPDVLTIRFAKGVESHLDLYPYMFQVARHTYPAARWLNFEHDLGIAGLRKSKLSFAPTCLLYKMRAHPRT